MGTFANSEDPVKQKNSAECCISSGSALFAKITTNFHRQKHTKIKKILALTPKKCKMDSPILIASICMGKSIRIERVNGFQGRLANF